MQNTKLQVIFNKQVSSRYWHMAVEAEGLANLTEPGQFFNVKCGDLLFPFLRRPFSIFCIDKRRNILEFLYLVKGTGTVKLTELQPGDALDVVGPLGKGFTVAPKTKSILLLARGVGVATLAALAQDACRKGIKCVAIVSARSSDDLLATTLLQEIGAEVFSVTDEAGTSGVEQVEELMERIYRLYAIDEAYTCGSKRLAHLLQRKADEWALPAQIALEEHMACAMGACYACVCDLRQDDVVRSVRICSEGPVFSLKEVMLT